jgi:hypothetical protein
MGLPNENKQWNDAGFNLAVYENAVRNCELQFVGYFK